VTPTDIELVAQARGGSQAAFREIVRRYQRPIYNLIVRIVRDRAAAEDLSQDTFLKAFSRLHLYDPQYKLSNWLFKIAHNTVVDFLRQRKPAAQPLESLTRGDRGSPAELHDTAACDPFESLARAELAEMLNRAVGGLRAEYRQVIVLRYHEDLSHEEISSIMGIPVGTVKSHLHRAREELADALRRLLPADASHEGEGGPATREPPKP
jgi:RNA polymerase sigma-70 factor (ECF subfamily)